MDVAATFPVVLSIAKTNKYSVFEINVSPPPVTTAASSQTRDVSHPPTLDHRDYDPVDNKLYKTKTYWDERFKTEESREWLGSYEELKLALDSQLRSCSTPPTPSPPTKDVLVVGSGNSLFSRDLKRDNPAMRVVSIDFSPTVVRAMSVRDTTTEYLEMDMTQMTFPSESFDLVVDKGSMDALVSDEDDPWNPPDSTCESVDAMMCSVARVLRLPTDASGGGVYVQISFQQPHFRLRHLKRGALTATGMWGNERDEFVVDSTHVETSPSGGLDYFIYSARWRRRG